MKNKSLYRTKPADYILALLILAVFATPLFSFMASPAAQDRAYVYKNNSLAAEISLKADSTTTLGKMVLEVRNGRIRVAESDCPNKICCHEGWISRPGQSLVCLPNRVLIEIPSKPGNEEYDTVSY